MNAHNRASAFKAANQAHLIHQIELHCSCTVSVQAVEDDYEGEWKVRGFRAWANRDDEFRPGSSRTVETSDGDTAIEALDKLALRLGYDPDVEAMITSPAATVAGSVNLLDAVRAVEVAA